MAGARKYIEHIQQQLNSNSNLDLDQVYSLVRETLVLNGASEEEMELLEEAKESIEKDQVASNRIEHVKRYSVFTPIVEEWYRGPKNTDIHWPLLRDYIEHEKGWVDAIEDIDEASTEIVSLLGNPARNTFEVKGLVVGHVQSGKTANMTAVISKAVDAGYNLVIVLAGLTNALRQQTQIRLDSDLVARAPHNWQLLTSREELGDFHNHPSTRTYLPKPSWDQSYLAVIKKNVEPLDALLEILSESDLTKLHLKCLIIDDECDQASVNASGKPWDSTAINARIRELLKELPRVSYVGYTATPFANVLIDPTNSEDLYPSNFITALKTPDKYFGAEKLFGRDPINADEEQPNEEGLDVIRGVPESEGAKILPRSAAERFTFEPELPESLRTAIQYFLLCCSEFRARYPEKNGDLSMLVHPSAYVEVHRKVADRIQTYVEELSGLFERGDSTLIGDLESLYMAELNRLPPEDFDYRRISWEEVKYEIPGVLGSLRYFIENSESDKRLATADGTGSPPRIVIGGSVLSRGLTIDRLVVSYFLRKSRQYDTLLQMGRWFGYRPGYEYLPRIWMPEGSIASFHDLATVEADIRNEIRMNTDRGLTPQEVAVRIRQLPGLAVTAAGKMAAAKVVSASFSGTHKQTIRFNHQDEAWLSTNWKAGERLAERARKESSDCIDLRSRRVWKGVPVSAIRNFLREYRFHDSHSDMYGSTLLDYIDREESKGNLTTWNVVLVAPENGPLSNREFDEIGPVNTNVRSRLKTMRDTGQADIKALMSVRDVMADVENPASVTQWRDAKEFRQEVLGAIPLLLLYPIDSESRAKSSRYREALDAADDVLGVGLVFPDLGDRKNYVSVDVSPSLDDEDQFESELINEELDKDESVDERNI